MQRIFTNIFLWDEFPCYNIYFSKWLYVLHVQFFLYHMTIQSLSQYTFYCPYYHIVVVWMRGVECDFFSQHTIHHELMVSVNILPTSFYCPPLPFRVLVIPLCFWMNCFILISIHRWEKKHIDTCPPVWLVSHLMSSSSVPGLQLIQFYFSLGLHYTPLYIWSLGKDGMYTYGIYIIHIYPFICWWTCRMYRERVATFTWEGWHFIVAVICVCLMLVMHTEHPSSLYPLFTHYIFENCLLRSFPHVIVGLFSFFLLAQLSIITRNENNGIRIPVLLLTFFGFLPFNRMLTMSL